LRHLDEFLKVTVLYVPLTLYQLIRSYDYAMHMSTDGLCVFRFKMWLDADVSLSFVLACAVQENGQRVAYSSAECREGAHFPSLGLEPVGG